MSRVMVAVGLVLALSVPSRAAAQGRHDRLYREFGPGVDTFPAGEVCDFALEVEWFEQVNINRFFDDEGNRIRAIFQYDQTNRFRNLETGLTLQEELHFVIDRDFTTGVQSMTGNHWRLRTESGLLVYQGSGLVVADFWTGEVYEATPNVPEGSFEEIICPLLGGAPAQ